MIMERAVSDKQIVERVKVQLYRNAVDSETSILPVPVTPSAEQTVPTPQATPTASASPVAAETSARPDEALQVLMLAQRTAEDHLAAVKLHATKVRGEAQALSERIHRDARSYADKVRAEADELLVKARVAAELSSQDAGARAAEIRRRAELTLADARTEAERIVAGGHDHAEQLKLRARQRFEDAVGGLSIEREALQKQIEALSVFDTDYRQRLTSLLQSQLRALWSGQPRATDGPGTEAQVPGGPVSTSGQS
jgi:cell division septum initiation protein DivIVA